MVSSIHWYGDFYGIAWAYEKNRLVICPIFDNEETAIKLAKELNSWNDRFTKLTIIEKENGEYSICCFQDPLISKKSNHVGIFRSGLLQISGYEQAKPMIKEKTPLLQIAYASNVTNMNTYEQVSRLISLSKCNIIKEDDLKKQQYYYEKIASESYDTV